MSFVSLRGSFFLYLESEVMLKQLISPHCYGETSFSERFLLLRIDPNRVSAFAQHSLSAYDKFGEFRLTC